MFLGLPWELGSLWLRPWLGAAATRNSIHGSDYLLAWQFFFFFLLLFSFFDCRRGSKRLSFQGPLPTKADGWKPLFGIKTALSFPLSLTIKIPTTKKPPKHCQGKKIHIGRCFHTLYYAFSPQCCDICPMVFPKRQPRTNWQNVLRVVCFPGRFIWNRMAPGFRPEQRAKGSASLGCTSETLQDQGDWNVKRPATGFTTPHYCLYASILKQGLPRHRNIS